jgi:hypothetical protein
MSNGPQILKRKARTCQSSNGCSLLALTAPELTLCNLPARRAPKDRFLPWLDANDDENDRSKRFAHSLLSRPDLVAGGHKTAAVWLHRRSGRHGALQTGVSVKRHFSRIFPASPRSLARCLSRARRHGASLLRPCGRPKGFGFQKIFVHRTRTQKIFRTFRKSATWH